MERKFNTKLTEIKNIGDELRFQREYYNFKNSTYSFLFVKLLFDYAKSSNLYFYT